MKLLADLLDTFFPPKLQTPKQLPKVSYIGRKTTPTVHLDSPKFKYVTSVDTNLETSFENVRKEWFRHG
jgi:hypothetical protein